MMEPRDDKERGARIRLENADRREPPAIRDVVFNPADRVLAIAILEEFERKLGLKFIDLRKREQLLTEILPTLKAIHDAAVWRANLFKWLLTTIGKFVLLTTCAGVGLAILLGIKPALGILIAKWLTP